MKYLIDTHVFIWYAVGDEKLSTRAKDLIESHHVNLISMARIWEIAIKVNIGHLEFREPLRKKRTDTKCICLLPILFGTFCLSPNLRPTRRA